MVVGRRRSRAVPALQVVSPTAPLGDIFGSRRRGSTARTRDEVIQSPTATSRANESPRVRHDELYESPMKDKVKSKSKSKALAPVQETHDELYSTPNTPRTRDDELYESPMKDKSKAKSKAKALAPVQESNVELYGYTSPKQDEAKSKPEAKGLAPVQEQYGEEYSYPSVKGEMMKRVTPTPITSPSKPVVSRIPVPVAPTTPMKKGSKARDQGPTG
jgi:hypothetical protein